ncbi:MAG: LytR/AlgR family response regulator transcription factor [Gammaproteobacteria bacterium]
MRILIADDEAPARLRLRRLLAEHVGGEVVAEAASGSEVLAAVERVHPDLVLLDIRMPDGDGLSVAHALRRLEVPPAVVFVTAHADRALAALEAGAAAYLVKPVIGERLAAAIERAGRVSRAQLSALSSDQPRRTHLSARIGRDIRLVPLAEVRYFRTVDKATIAVYGEHEVVVEESLNALKQEFGTLFLRARRNLLVARSVVRGLHRMGEGYSLDLTSGERLPVSRRLVRQLKSALSGIS